VTEILVSRIGRTTIWQVLTAGHLGKVSGFWVAIAIIGSIDVAWMRHNSIEIAVWPFTRFILTLALFCGAAWLVRRGRPNFVKVSAARVFRPSAQILLIMMVIAPLSYLIESLRMPLIDDSLRAIDTALGFNWQNLTSFILDHSAISLVLAVAYSSILWQTVIVLTICSVGARPRESEFVQYYALSAIICVVVRGMLPALGEPAPLSTFPMEFARVRSGHWEILDYGAMQGLVAFPSFHTAFAIICVYTVRHSLPALFGVGALNLLMLLSIPTFGGHYLTDMIGGAAVAVASILSTHRLNKLVEPDWRVANNPGEPVVG
jgi:hypothetical protein